MGAFFILLGLITGLAGPVMVVVLFCQSYAVERKRIVSGGKAQYHKTLLPGHPEDEDLVSLSARAKELGIGE